MIFNGVRLPEELSAAIEEDRLVVFAGAGVSRPPPSNIPVFNGLARRINDNKDVPPGREDRILGRLAREGRDVHAAATQIVFHPQTHPTELHTEILRLFSASCKARIVTTNFDNHFSTAARTVFRKELLREYYAPALPLGDEFSGLVYLHGSARENPKSLVLTDKDFGRAYLTRGWARDFLIPLFSKYTVLFVGYSHSDVTMTYLARGLNVAEIKPRWAMVSGETTEDARRDWEHLEISIAEYPLDPNHPDNKHQPLTGFFSGWADYRRETVFERSRRVRGIARALPPESDTDSEYLDCCLRERRLAHDFCAALRHQHGWAGYMITVTLTGASRIRIRRELRATPTTFFPLGCAPLSAASTLNFCSISSRAITNG
jgi:hypothetical protein